ncbi:MAG: AZOBR_p60025 family cell surface glycopolymer formation protein [Streptosporangiaceae bacterium]
MRLQLTSTSEEDESVRQRASSPWSSLDRPIVAGVIALVAWLGFVLARWQIWANGNLSKFILLGSGRNGFTNPAQLPRGVAIGDPNQAGYDGQFYYRLALGPFDWARTAFGITMDQSYRYTRIGYPVLAWLVSFGQHQLVPYVLVLINLFGVAAMAVLGGMFARASGRHALFGLAFAAYFGLVISVGRDTAEPVAEACMLGGLLAYRRSRYLLAAGAFAFGAITRETILFAPAGIAVVRLVSMARRQGEGSRPGLADLTWVVPAVAYGVLEVAVHFVVKGKFPLLANTSRNLTSPFTALYGALKYDVGHINTAHLSPIDIALLEYATVAVFIVAGLAVLKVTTAPVHERLAFVFFVLELGLLSKQIWTSTFGDGRSLIEVYLMALILLLATPRRRYLSSLNLTLIVAWVLPALLVVARRRALYM